jgi:ubiquinone/menaquinone biosynthesis C-methylase UbiE
MKREQLSKHAKYTTANPISKALVSRFFKSFGELFLMTNSSRVLDVGCGEGLMLHYLNNLKEIQECYAVDYDEHELEDAKKNIPFCKLHVGDIHSINLEENICDTVLCSEVLEHVSNPNDAVKELHRVTREYALLSVPREPLWRIFNMIRMKYWFALGNTPGHVNHWSYRTFVRLVQPYFSIVAVRKPLPWTILLCKKK